MHVRTVAWLLIYKRLRALYEHDGNPRRPHPVFIEGGHSKFVFNGDLVTEEAALLDRAAADLVQLLADEGFDFESVDCVAAPAWGGIKIAHDIARHVARRKLSGKCRDVFCEKRSRNGRKWMVFARTPLKPGERVFFCDDTTTAGGTKERMKAAAEKAGATVLPHLLLLFNRSGESEVCGLRITTLASLQLPVWSQEECPLCKLGSKAIRVKGANWPRFTQTY